MEATVQDSLLDMVTIPEDGVISRTVFSDERIKVVIFGFSKGQELSEHTASMPAIIEFLKGEADVTLGTKAIQAVPGTWVHMPPGLPHSIHARTDTIMLLTLLKPLKA